MTGFKKRLLIVSLYLTALYLMPMGSYGQDQQPAYDPGFIDQPTGVQDQQPDDQQSDGLFGKRYKDDVIYTMDSSQIQLVNPDFGSKGRGGAPFNSSNGGPGTLDPGGDPDAPFDEGLFLLLAVGLTYGIRGIFLNRKSVSAG
jgi:hypothetical protein